MQTQTTHLLSFQLDLLPLAVGSFLAAFFSVLVLGPKTIEYLRVLKFGQNVNEDAPDRHKQKQGTPTMGGVLLVLGVLLALLLGLCVSPQMRPLSPQLVAVVLVFVAHAGLGFLDDFLKARRGKSLGLKARQKLAGQIVIALAFVLWLYATAQSNFTTQVWFWRDQHLDFGYFYYPIVFVLMIGLSNAANLTDGLDGLAGGLAIFALLGLALTMTPNFVQLPLFACTLAGACLGFLWYNAHPAKVFMGDTGSLALGSSFAALGIIGKQEVLMLVFCAVFLMEMFSVLIQVGVVRATGGKAKGRRVFKMTPIHHHFELSGWAETQVVARFWIFGILALILGLLLAPALSGWM